MFQVATAAAAPGGGTGGLFQMIWPLALMFVIFYFLLIRPNQKKQKQRQAMLQALKKGDKVITIGGLHGTIVEITDDVVVLRVNDVTKLTFDRSAISNAIVKETASEEAVAKS